MHDTTASSRGFGSFWLDNNLLYGLFSPMLLVLRVGGLFYITENGAQPKPQKPIQPEEPAPITVKAEQLTGKRVGETLSKYYSFFAGLCIIAYFLSTTCATESESALKNFGSFFTYKKLPKLIDALSPMFWHAHIICGYLILAKVSWKGDLYSFFVMWKISHYSCINNDYSCTNFPLFFRVRRNIAIVGLLILISVQMVISWQSELKTVLLSSSFSVIGIKENPYMSTIIFITGTFFASIVNFAPVFFVILIGFTLQGDFQHLADDLSMQLTDRGELKGSLEWFRQRHDKLCMLLDHADEMCSLYALITLGISLVQMFMLMYLVVYQPVADVWTRLEHSFWFFVYLLQPGLLLWMGAKVTNAAHAPRRLLHRLDHAKLTIVEILQLHTFLEKVTFEKIGFTAANMFSMDSATALSVIGAYLTYQILLFQLQLDLKSGQPTEINTCRYNETNVTTIQI